MNLVCTRSSELKRNVENEKDRKCSEYVVDGPFVRRSHLIRVRKFDEISSVHVSSGDSISSWFLLQPR
jgi:hypothetical protein